jgi:hypothetical protein
LDARLGFHTSSASALSSLTNANYKLQAIRQRYRLVAYAGERARLLCRQPADNAVDTAITSQRVRRHNNDLFSDREDAPKSALYKDLPLTWN